MYSLLKAFLLILTILVSESYADQQVTPQAIEADYNFLCGESISFAKRKFEITKNIQPNMEPKLIYWNSVDGRISTEVIVIAHSTTCGNMGCLALLASKFGSECVTKPISAVQPHKSVKFIGDGVVEIKNIGECVRWHIDEKSYIRGKCS